MTLENFRKTHRLLDIFVEIAEIPSPSMKEQEVTEKILEIFSIYGIRAIKDSYGNIIAKIPATKECRNVPPILLSAHMDVVGGSDKVVVQLSKCNKYIETDKKRTLGADNKAGIAAIIDLAVNFADLNNETEHGPIEITFTRDEESGMSGIRNLDTSILSSEYCLIADGEYLGELDTEGAGITHVYISVTGGKGGHSGIDVKDKSRINAIKVISEIAAQIPQGVYKDSENGVITSINAGVTIGGAAGIYLHDKIKEIKDDENWAEQISTNNFMPHIAQNSYLNMISQEAYTSYSIRSSDKNNEKELIELIKTKAQEINGKYNGMIDIDIIVQDHIPPFKKSDDNFLTDVILKAAEKCKIKSKPSIFHAAAETHILANEKVNLQGKNFKPVIVGVANLKNIHSSDEKMEWKSFIEGRKWLEQIIIEFAEKYKSNLM